MKKKTNSDLIRQYMALGGTAMNIKTPDEVLHEMQLNTQQASAAATVAGLPLQALSGLLLQGGNMMTNMGKSKSLSKGDIEQMELGGMAQQVPINAEDGELLKKINGGVKKIDGASHAQGGENLLVDPGDKIFSKKIKVDGKSLADLMEEALKRESKIAEQRDKTGKDIALINALDRTKGVNKQMEASFEGLQSLVKELTGDPINNNGAIPKMELGTGNDPLKDIYGNITGSTLYSGLKMDNLNLEDIKYRLGKLGYDLDLDSKESVGGLQEKLGIKNDGKFGEDTLYALQNRAFTIEPEFAGLLNRDNDIKEKLGGLKELDLPTQYATPLTDEQIAKASAGNSEKSIYEQGFNLNNIIGTTGTLVNTLGPLMNTENSRLADTPRTNNFKDFGQESLKTIEGTEKFVEQLRANQMKELELSKNAARNKRTGRSANVDAAFAAVTDANAERARIGIDSGYANNMLNILNGKSALQTQIDQIVMSGDETSDNLNRASRDNYYTQRGNAIAGIGGGLQTLAKTFNTLDSNTKNLNLIELMEKEGLTLNQIMAALKVAAKATRSEDNLSKNGGAAVTNSILK